MSEFRKSFYSASEAPQSRRNFVHSFLPRTELESVTSPDGKRKYRTPNGVWLPSVTTVLGEIPDDDPDWREKWVAIVGEAEADRVTVRGRVRGAAMHKIAEKFLMNDPYWEVGAMPSVLTNFRQVRPLLEQNVGTIMGIELPLWSETLGTAGTSDLVAGWQGWNSIVDHKNASQPKNEVMIKKYFLQATCYALMVTERYGINIPQVVVIIAVDHDQPQVFVQAVSDWEKEVRSVFSC